jgi:hypothetical protein
MTAAAISADPQQLTLERVLLQEAILQLRQPLPQSARVDIATQLVLAQIQVHQVACCCSKARWQAPSELVITKVGQGELWGLREVWQGSCEAVVHDVDVDQLVGQWSCVAQNGQR